MRGMLAWRPPSDKANHRDDGSKLARMMDLGDRQASNENDARGLRVSRRALLVAAASTWGCPSSKGGRQAAGPASLTDAAFGGLEVVQRGDLRDADRGGTAVVLLHGWGAPGDDLVDLAGVLAQPRTRFFFPVAPLPEVGGGRAWWHLDAADRPRHAGADDAPATAPPHPQLLRVRTAIQGVLRTIRTKFVPETLILGGFSQGAMLSLDVAVQGEPAVDRVVALSGLLLQDSLAAMGAARAKRPPVLLAHGEDDQVVPFRAGELARTLLTRAGFPVTFRPFAGGHTIPAETIDHVRAFLVGGA